MNIAFVSTINPHDINQWSGSLYYIYHTLSKNHNVILMGDDIVSNLYFEHVYNKRGGKFYPENYLREIGNILSDKINSTKVDIVIIRDYYFPPFLNISVPIVYISDTTFDLFKAYLGIIDNKYALLADKTEQILIDKCDLLVYSSNWVKKNAVTHYGADARKIKVIEFGANIPEPENYQLNIDTNICNLLFIGRNWGKKGGEKVLKAYHQLKKEGFSCTLTIIGSTPPQVCSKDKDLTIIPFLDKSKPDDLKLLYDILYRSHFLILPTEFEAFGIVFCEASAYGLPSIAANVGGVSQPIREGKNGFLLSPNATAEEYAEKIKLAFSDKETYLKLRRSSRNEYEKRLNWRIWGKKMDKILDKTIKEYSNNKEKHTHEEFYLPVYVINMRNRVERRSHIEKQFQGKPEFKLTWIEAIEHPIGAVGLWKSMVKVVETAIINDDDIIIICEDDHTFTSAYSKEYFFANIIAANNQESELLSGGIGGFGTAVPVDSNRYWIDWFWCTQFIVVFKPLFQKILDYDFQDTDTADGVLSVIANNKMTLYPFISIQKDFGYSDVTCANNEFAGMITNHFRQTDMRLSLIHHVADRFKQ